MRPSPRSVPLVLCLLGVVLCLVAVGPTALSQPSDAAAVGPTEPQATDGLALPERLVVGDDARHGSTELGADVSSSIDRSGAELDGAYERALLEEQLERAETDRERRQVLATWADRVQTTLVTLERREQASRHSYYDEDREVRSLLHDLRAVNDRAAQVETVADTIETEADAIGADNVTNQIEALQGDLVIRQGPVRDSVGEVATGDRRSGRIYVSASQNGTVLATIDEDGYHREATRNDLLQARGRYGTSLSDMFPITREQLYPVHDQHYDFSSLAGRVVLFQLYYVAADDPEAYPHGELRSYVDGVSERVFWEYQRLELDEDLPTRDSLLSSNDSLTVTVERTYPTGPARVTVTDEDGDPVSGAAVSVDGVDQGQTGDDGVRWVILPEDVEAVSATHGDSSVEVGTAW